MSKNKTAVAVPNEVAKLFNKVAIIRQARAECKGAGGGGIKYDNKSRHLVFRGSLEKKQKAMIIIYESLEKMDVKFNGLVEKTSTTGFFFIFFYP